MHKDIKDALRLAKRRRYYDGGTVADEMMSDDPSDQAIANQARAGYSSDQINNNMAYQQGTPQTNQTPTQGIPSAPALTQPPQPSQPSFNPVSYYTPTTGTSASQPFTGLADGNTNQPNEQAPTPTNQSGQSYSWAPLYPAAGSGSNIPHAPPPPGASPHANQAPSHDWQMPYSAMGGSQWGGGQWGGGTNSGTGLKTGPSTSGQNRQTPQRAASGGEIVGDEDIMRREIKDALRLAKSTRYSQKGNNAYGVTPVSESMPQQKPYSRFNDFNRMLKSPPQVESPAHSPEDPKYNVSPEEYRKGTYEDIYGTRYDALSHGGSVDRKGYNRGGPPTGLTVGTNPAGTPTDLTVGTNPAGTNVYDPFVKSAYQTFMNRAPDAAGQQYWSNQLQSGDISQRDLLNSFANSAEFQNLYATSPERAVSGLYQSALGRAPDEGGLSYWQQQQQKGMSANDMLNQFTNSQEFQNAYDINNAYMQYQGAMATPDQLASAHRDLASGKTMSDVEGMISADPKATSNFVKTAYQNMLGRAPDEAGYNYWSNALNSGAVDKTAFMNALAGSVEGGNYANTQTLNNLYERFTGNQPDQTILNSPEYNDMLSKMAEGTINIDQIKSQVSKDPYAVNYQNQNLVKDTFTALTGKVPSQSVVDDYTSKLAAGTIDSSLMFDEIAATPESQKFVDAKKYVMAKLNAPLTPQEQAVIDMISSREGAKDPNAIYGYNKYADKVGYTGNLTKMTPNQIFPMQTLLTKLTRAAEGRPSSAVGSGQFIQGTLRSTINDLAKKYGVDKDVLANIEFDPNFQKQVTLQNFRTYVGDPNDPSTWNKYRLGKQWESFDTAKGKKPLSQQEINAILNASGPLAPPPAFATPGEITQSTGETITDGGVGGLGTGTTGTPSMFPTTGTGGMDFSAPSTPAPTYTPPSTSTDQGASLQGDGSQMVPIYKTVTTPGTTSTLVSNGQQISYNVPGTTKTIIDGYQPAWQAAGFQSQGDYADAADSGYSSVQSYYRDNPSDDAYFVPASYTGEGGAGWYDPIGGYISNDQYNSFFGIPLTDEIIREHPDWLGLKRGGSVKNDKRISRGLELANKYTRDMTDDQSALNLGKTRKKYAEGGGKAKQPKGSVELMPDYMSRDDWTPERWAQARRNRAAKTPNSGPSDVTPKSGPAPATPDRSLIPSEDYERGNLTHGQYALADGGSVERNGYATGGAPTDLAAGTNPATPASPYQSYVSNLYKNILGRQADTGGQQYWENQLGTGATTTQDMLNNFAQSQEYQNLYKSDPTKAVSGMYQAALDRAPEQAGLQYWTGQAQHGLTPNQLASQFASAPEFQNRDAIFNSYLNYTGEAPTPEQYAAAQNDIRGGKSLIDVASGIVSSPAANANLVKTAYQEMLGRSPEPEALNYWTNQLNKGTLDTTGFLNGLASSSEGANYANTKTVDNMYESMFGVAPTAQDMKNPYSTYNDYLSKLAAGTLNADSLYKTMQADPLAQNYQNKLLLNDTAHQLLGRAATVEEQNNYLPRLATGELDAKKMAAEIAARPDSQAYQKDNANVAPRNAVPKPDSTSYGYQGFKDYLKNAMSTAGTDIYGKVEALKNAIEMPLSLREQAGLDLLSGKESGGNYSTILGDNKGPGTGAASKHIGYTGNLETMPLDQVYKLQGDILRSPLGAQKNSSAVGKYQFVRNTLFGTEKAGFTDGELYKMGITPDMWGKITFSPALQDKITAQRVHDMRHLDLGNTNTWFKPGMTKEFQSMPITLKNKEGLKAVNSMGEGPATTVGGKPIIQKGTPTPPGTPTTPDPFKPGDQSSLENYNKAVAQYKKDLSMYWFEQQTQYNAAKSYSYGNLDWNSWSALAERSAPKPPDPGKFGFTFNPDTKQWTVPIPQGQPPNNIGTTLAGQGAGGNVAGTGIGAGTGAGGNVQPGVLPGVTGNAELAASLAQQSAAQQASYLAQAQAAATGLSNMGETAAGMAVAAHQTALQNYLTATGSQGLSYLMGFSSTPPTDRMGNTVLPPSGFGISYGGGGGGSGGVASSGGSGGVGSGGFGLAYMNKGGAVKPKRNVGHALRLSRRLLEQ